MHKRNIMFLINMCTMYANQDEAIYIYRGPILESR